MSVFTVVIIIGVIYQLGVSLMKKGKQQTPGKLSDPLKLPDGRSIREALHEKTSQGSWLEQLQRALQNAPNQQPESLQSVKSTNYDETTDVFVETEGTQGIEGTSDYVGVLGLEAYKSTEESSLMEAPRVPQAINPIYVSLTERDLVQGVMWAEILGKPRALRSFRGPQSRA